MVCVGAPVFFGASSGEAVAAVAVSLPRTTFNAARRKLAVRTVRDLADHISQRLGARRANTGG
jgi:DNA-binding IclR family transcriptional regulator